MVYVIIVQMNDLVKSKFPAFVDYSVRWCIIYHID